jgi:hypothetical protein
MHWEIPWWLSLNFLFKLCVINKGYADKLSLIEIVLHWVAFCRTESIVLRSSLHACVGSFWPWIKKVSSLLVQRNLMQVNVTSRRSVNGAWLLLHWYGILVNTERFGVFWSRNETNQHPNWQLISWLPDKSGVKECVTVHEIREMEGLRKERNLEQGRHTLDERSSFRTHWERPVSASDKTWT